MFNTNSTMSPADIAACTNSYGGFGNDSSWFLWIIVILALFNGGNWGTNNSSGAYDNYVLSSDFATLQRQIDTLGSDLKQSVVSIGNGLSSLGYDQLNQFNNVNKTVMQSTYDISSQLSNIASAQQSNCCATNNNITSGFADLNYNIATQSCATRQTINDGVRSVIDNDNANYRALNDKLTQMEMNAKDDKIAALALENQNLRFAASQQAQNTYLVNALNPTPSPAYIVANPNGCGCSCSCNC